jgi:cobalt/nickel transport system permease protein
MTGTGNQLFAINAFGLKLDISTDGANLALLLIVRTFGGMCSLFFIALTTPMVEIFSDLKSLNVAENGSTIMQKSI